MYLITLNWQLGKPVPLFITANRDEFYTRPAPGLHRRSGQRSLTGQELQAGVTFPGKIYVDLDK